MKRFFTVERIKQTLRSAEGLGITAFIGRADRHITRLLFEYWGEGGSIRWIAQTCPETVSAARSNNADREAMVSLIRRLSKPAIHYKIFAAGRMNPKDAFEFAARHLRPGDGVCIGVYQERAPGIVAEDVRLFEEYVRFTSAE